jgi:predicted nucleic acid-binding protein
MRAPSVCWDSTVFIAILTGEKRKSDEDAGLREVMELIDAGKLVVVTSAMAVVEVLNHSATGEIRAKFNALFTSPRFVMADVTAAIAEKARDVRENLPKGVTLKGADSTFIATAIVYGCSALHSFDRHQLRLNGLACVDRLPIRHPRAEQTVLPLTSLPPSQT